MIAGIKKKLIENKSNISLNKSKLILLIQALSNFSKEESNPAKAALLINYTEDIKDVVDFLDIQLNNV